MGLWEHQLETGQAFFVSQVIQFCTSIASKRVMVEKLHALQSRTGPGQGQNRVFPVYFFHMEKPVFITGEPFSHCRDPVFITGISLLEKIHRENPVFITGNGFAVWVFPSYRFL